MKYLMIFAVFLVFVNSAAIQPVDDPFERKYQSVKHSSYT